MEEPLFPDPPGGLTPEAQRAYQDFLADYDKMLEATKAISFSILVWGPSPSSLSKVAKKRIEIRQELIRLGHNAMFSEDIPDKGSDLSEKSKEYAQARVADAIYILLEDSPGALAETHDFCNDPKIAPNVYVLAPQRYKSGYSGRGAIKDLEEAYQGVYWYQDDEIDRCSVLSKVVTRTEARRNIIARSKHGAP